MPLFEANGRASCSLTMFLRGKGICPVTAVLGLVVPTFRVLPPRFLARDALCKDLIVRIDKTHNRTGCYRAIRVPSGACGQAPRFMRPIRYFNFPSQFAFAISRFK